MLLSRRAVFGAFFLLSAALAGQAWADKPYVYAPGGLALSGFDPVSYFSEDGPVLGNPEYSIVWRGAVWRFASPESLLTFEMNPTAFAPQFGGYCTYSVAHGGTSSSVPEAWVIVNDNLYLMHTTDMVETFRPDMPELITSAQSHWPAALKGN